VGEGDPDKLDYKLEASEGVKGVIFKVNLKGYGTRGSVSS